MDRAITRSILWNVPASFIALMYGLVALLIAAFVYVGWQWYRCVSLDRAEDRVDQPARRLFRAMRDGVGQLLVSREAWLSRGLSVARRFQSLETSRFADRASR
jgi:hypothetical protein